MHTAQDVLRACKHAPAPVSEARIRELRALGYKVEDMAAEYGPSFTGQFRFINIRTADFQDCNTSCCEASAWHAAHLHADRVGVMA